MVDVKKFLDTAGGNWLKADHVTVGDKLQILNEGTIDDKSFDKPYIVMKMRLLRTMVNYDVRLGSKNVERLADGFGSTDTSKWVGRQVEVISTETYRGLGQKGFILRGLPPEPEQQQLAKQPTQSEGLSEDALQLIRNSEDIISMGLPLNRADWDQSVPAKVRVELLKLGLVEEKGDLYFFTEAARAYLK